jgi:rhodanese-related sulfurtransferase
MSDKITAILAAAQQRAKEMKLPYQGALYPDEAYTLLQSVPNAKLVDIRTRAELDWVGYVPNSVDIEWSSYPDMKPNPNFLQELGQQIEKDTLVLFFCRSGIRSHSAAIVATQAGYATCFNVLEGFEGDKDKSQHRNITGGWRAAGLPWEQN